MLHALTKTTNICTGPFGHRSLVGDELVRRRAMVSKGRLLWRETEGEEREGSMQGLTVVAADVEAGSVMAGRRRKVADDLGGRTTKTRSGTGF